ncbi:MAG: hypothetical protein ABIO70_22270 [Pseudomonadota bacterium]
MYHFVAHAVLDRWLFHDWEEALALWVRLATLPELRALVVMPDHVHAVLGAPAVARWLAALRGYARWRSGRACAAAGPTWMPLEPPEILPGWKHQRRTVRYVHLNPCRDGLANDPLGWPFSTHRDAVGLAAPAVIAPTRDAVSFHAYVSGDPSVEVAGTTLPFGRACARGVAPEGVLAAVSAVSRTPLAQLGQRGGPRDLLVGALRELSHASQPEVARLVGISVATVRRAPAISAAQLHVVERVLGDVRFAGLGEGDLARSPAWRAYRYGRLRRGAYEILARGAAQRRARELAWRRFEEDLTRHLAALGNEPVQRKGRS